MMTAMHSVFLAVTDPDAACRPYERLGLKVSPVRAGRRTLLVGGPTNLFAIHFLDATSTEGLLARPLRDALDAARPLIGVGLCVADLGVALGELEAKGVQAARFREGDEELAWLPLHGKAGTDLVLLHPAHTAPERHAAAGEAGLLESSFPLERLDHLAAVTHDLEEKTRYWTETLGVPVAGEVVTPTMVIRQFRLGDAVLELLGPASPDSPMWKRPPGLVGMASWEVANLDHVVGLARAAGFAVPDPAAGVLPGTRIATIQGTDLAGVNMQLLQYV